MGSFSTSCVISGLPIGNDDPVRLLALMDNHRERRGYGTVTGLWAPVTPALKARYNDYGTVDPFEEGVGADLFFNVLNTFAISGVKSRLSRSDWLCALYMRSVRMQDVLKGQSQSYLEYSRTPRITHEDAFNLTKAMAGQFNQLRQVDWAMVREDVWQVLLNMMPLEGAIPPESVIALAYEDVSEMQEVRRVESAMYLLNRIWTPGHTCGPQQPEWEFPAEFSKRVAQLAEAAKLASEEGY